MSWPEWLDENLSKALPLLRDRGEGQHLEFMERYPENGHELSREIAAFASSNPGTILIGITDDGQLAGLDGANTPQARDQLCRRIEGVCCGNVRPAITPVVKFAKEGEAIVVVIEVPRGSEPIYYSKYTPYVRHLSQSRPAEPHEVIDRIGEWLRSNQVETRHDPISSFLSSLAPPLIEILIYGSEFQDRTTNPWLDLMRTQLSSAGEELRRSAAHDVAVAKGLTIPLRFIADELEAAASHRLTLGGESWNTLTRHVALAVQEAEQVKAVHIDTMPLSQESKREISELIRRSARELSNLDARAKTMADDGRIEELQDAASRIGHSLLLAKHYRLEDQSEQFTEELGAVGQELHLLETERLYMDGGQSMKRIIDRVHDLTARLQTLLPSD